MADFAARLLKVVREAENPSALTAAAIGSVLRLHWPAPQYRDEFDPPCAGCATHVTFTPMSKCRTLAALGEVFGIPVVESPSAPLEAGRG